MRLALWRHMKETNLLNAITENVFYEVCPEGIQPCAMKNRDLY